LFTLEREGRAVPALAVGTKSGHRLLCFPWVVNPPSWSAPWK
jgi:hypothetical protein